MLANVINPTPSSLRKKYFPSSRTSRTLFLPLHWTSPFQTINLFASSSFTLCFSSQKIQIQLLLPYFKKVFPPGPSHNFNLLDCGNPTATPRQNTLTLLYVMTIGPVQTTTPTSHASLSKRNSMMVSLKSCRTSQQLKRDGLKVLPWALGKLGVVHADNREPRLVLDSTICGMNGRCHLPEKQRLPNLRHISFFLSSCPPLQEEWQGASIDIKAAHKRMPIREDERGSLLFKFDDRLFAYRSAHFGAKTSAWHWGRVSGALLRLLHSLLYFRHAAWVYVDDFFLLFPKSAVQFTLAIILLRTIGTPLSWKKLEFDRTIDWNGRTIHPGTMIAQLPPSKQEKINSLITTVLQSPSRKNLEKIIGILLWATSLVHHVRFLLTSLYRDLYSILVTNYSIKPTEWESFLNLLNDCATITTHNHLHLPVGSRLVEFKHTPITSRSQLPRDVKI